MPTIFFVVADREPAEIARALAEENIFVWDGHNYALEVIRRLGLEETGGVVRIGIAHYNTAAEVDRLLAVLARAID